VSVFDVQVYGRGGGVMFSYTLRASSADDAVEQVASMWAGYPQAAKVGVWERDRQSHASGDIPEHPK